MKKQTEHEKLYTLILNHMLERDKKILLFEKEPITRRKKKLEFYKNQI